VPIVAAGSEKNLQEEYDRGVAHLQAKEYDKAIERFNRLQRTPLEAKARPQIEEASKLAAQDMRQKAAELFVRATNSRDTDEKRKLLLSSRDLLQSILVKYPQSGLADKVQKNLARIEAELRAVEASSIPKPATSGGAYVPPKPGGGAGIQPSTSL
jgi:outer membrane protein assembly factor BamD (BamD/ComL family)